MGFSPGRRRCGVGVLDPRTFYNWVGVAPPPPPKFPFYYFFSKLRFSQHPCIDVGMRVGGGGHRGYGLHFLAKFSP